jgi:hypothetical protein
MIQTSPSTQETRMKSIPTGSRPAKDWWHPTIGLSWQWNLTGELDLSVEADVWDIDLDVDETIIQQLHQQGARVICYISVGSYEDWRPDAGEFASEVLGRDYEGWPGEKWLDIRRIDLVAPIMLARLDLCAAKGFDAVEPDNMEIHTNRTGFPIRYADQLRYSIWLAEEAHRRGLAIGQKNAPDMVKDLVDVFDFAIIEDAFYYGWAEDMRPYTENGKSVFAAEYTDLPGDFSESCRLSKEFQFSTILKGRDLNSEREICP